MKVLFRPCVASDERSSRLLRKLQMISSLVSSVEIIDYYWIITSVERFSDPTDQILVELLKADWLLDAGFAKAVISQSELNAIITPRSGTLSPWSTKATNIIKNIGLSEIDRIEWGKGYRIICDELLDNNLHSRIINALHDPMTESVFESLEQVKQSLSPDHNNPAPLVTIPVIESGLSAIEVSNETLGLALSSDEMKYLFEFYNQEKRNPTDAELMMFAQVNSEHCRHKIFNAQWNVDGQLDPLSLFDMIRETYRLNPTGVLSAYRDNASVISGFKGDLFFPDPHTGHYKKQAALIHILMKVETHNHPTAIAPYEGAATGAGGEIRDEGATGLGSKPKAALTGFSVSNLNIPGWIQPWEVQPHKPQMIASALEIMTEGPLGSASFNNEFGRPNLCGYFRTYEQTEQENTTSLVRRGYHKPIMIAGGLGHIQDEHVNKKQFKPGAILIVLGGAAMRIGLGGGAASSVASGMSNQALDFASVQRSNPEMERRCQEVIDRCCHLGNENPIAFIHDVGAGGLSNALPELIRDGGCGGLIELRSIPSDEPSMSPLAIWCNESQERYVMAINPDKLSLFEAICQRERCPYAAVGTATDSDQLTVNDAYFNNQPIDLPLSMLLSDVPRQIRTIQSKKIRFIPFDESGITIDEAIIRVLKLPAVAAKHFLITIGDRSITGQVVREQMVGPWQIPVGDHAVTCHSYSGYRGEAMSMGERSPVALLSPEASGRLAVGEAITNLASSAIGSLSSVKLSANWMAAIDYDQEDLGLYNTVKAVALELCPALGLTIPVGKDSLSMQTVWDDELGKRSVISPLSLIISAFSPVTDVRKSVTPQLRLDQGETVLLLIDLGEGRNGLGGTALAQVYNQVAGIPADVHSPSKLKAFFDVIQILVESRYLLAYHDRSDGGLITTLFEMAFAGQTGLDIQLDTLASNDKNVLSSVFSEELGAVIQIKTSDLDAVMQICSEAGLSSLLHKIGYPTVNDRFNIQWKQNLVLSNTRIYFQRLWQETSYRMQALRDDEACAKSEFDDILTPRTGLTIQLSQTAETMIKTAPIFSKVQPKVGILREQGVNGQIEMAAAFDRAGFEVCDVHMSDLVEGNQSLSEYIGLVFCGGFSYGDVLGAGMGWASTILYNSRVSDLFSEFFHRSNTFTLGVCNGCQTLSHLKHLMPGADHWPQFVKNQSRQFEARTVMVKIEQTPSILLNNLSGTLLPIPIAHAEGRLDISDASWTHLEQNNQVVMRYVKDSGEMTTQYPHNPNGSIAGVAGLTTVDGRVTIMMPHPERAFRMMQQTWLPSFNEKSDEDSPWMQLFYNARRWVN